MLRGQIQTVFPAQGVNPAENYPAQIHLVKFRRLNCVGTLGLLCLGATVADFRYFFHSRGVN